MMSWCPHACPLPTAPARFELTFKLIHYQHSATLDSSQLGRGRAIDQLCEPRWHILGTTGVFASNLCVASYDADLGKQWWARTVSNRRPLVCKGTGQCGSPFAYVQY